MTGMDGNRTDDLALSPSLKRLCIAIAIGSVLVVAAYILKFSNAQLQLSGSPADWGVFGDYLGGTLGTFFGFAAFIGVLVTIAIQREQLNQARKQAYFDELQRFLSNAAERVDAMLDRELKLGPTSPLQSFANAGRRVTLLSLIASVGYVKAGALDKKKLNEGTLEAAIDVVSTEVPPLATDLEYMAVCMQIYQQRGGDSDIVKLYRLRYSGVVGWLYIAGLLRNEAVNSQFPVQDFVEQMTKLRDPS